MKKTLLSILAIALALSCTKEEISCDFSFEVASGGARIVEGAIAFAGTASEAVITIIPQNPSASWTASTPSSDVWCNSYTDRNGALNLCIGENLSDEARTSCLFVQIGSTKRRVPVIQDYLKLLEFSLAENSADASGGQVRVPVRTNLADDQIAVSVEEGCSWIEPSGFSLGKALFNVDRNPSETSARQATVTVTSGLMSSSALLVQAPMSGTAYVVPVAGLSFDSYPVFEIFDQEQKIGEICREYLYSYDRQSGVTIVDGVFRVAYPAVDGKVDYTRGLVLENGGQVSWNDTGIASYEAGEGAAGSAIYFARGAKGFRTAEVDPADSPKTASVLQMKVVDERSGAPDSAGNTTESYTYSVVKIGLQYWMRENLRTSRFADGSPIPTGFDKPEWVAGTTPTLKPMCLVSATSSSNTWLDANVPEAASTRNQYGCLYTYAAIVKQDIDVSQSRAAVFDKVDRISPGGWRVPYLSDYKALSAYLCQKDYASQTEMNADVVPKLLKTGTNQTGFSGAGTRWRGSTGGYNTGLCYMTMDYAFEGGAHYIYDFRLREGDYALTYNITTSSGSCLRLIRNTINE